jgi:hypothetical protein
VKKLKPSSLLIILFLSICFANPLTASANVTYTLHLSGVDSGIAGQISNSMSEAVGYYNQYGEFDKQLNVYYSSGVPTAQANYDGVITFGGQRNTRVALHEMCHTMGIGTQSRYGNLMTDGTWDGPVANDLLSTMDGAGSVVHGDSQHFWPYGLNYDSEDSETNRIRHVQLVEAMRCDMGIGPCTGGEETGNVPEGYDYAGGEGDEICPDGTYNIAYGANGQFFFLYNQSGCIDCNNATFGDPLHGVVKSCYVQAVSSGDASDEDTSEGGITGTNLRIVNRACGMVMDALGNSNGSNIIIDTDDGTINQRFNITDLGGGEYSIQSAQEGNRSVDVWNWGTSNGTNIALYEYWGGATQRFYIEEVDNGYYRITPEIAPDQCLDAYGTSSGSNVGTWNYGGRSNQQWSIE